MRVTCLHVARWWIFRWRCHAFLDQVEYMTAPDGAQLHRAVCQRGHRMPWARKPRPSLPPPAPAPLRVEVTIKREGGKA